MGKKKQTPRAAKKPLETKIQVDADIDRPAEQLRRDSSASTVASTVASKVEPQRAPRKAATRKHPAERVAAIILIIAVLVAFAFFITLIVVDDATLHGAYDNMFTPRSVSPYKVWGYTTLTLTALAVVLSVAAFAAETFVATKCSLLCACVIYIALLTSGNILGSHETTARAGYEVEFAAKFNTFYCDTRTVRVCLSGDHKMLLTLTRGSNTTIVQPNENAIDVATSVWDRCQTLLMWGIDSTGDHIRTTSGDRTISDGVLAIDTKPLYEFLDDHSSSSATDVWCGAANNRNTTMSDAEQRALPSPYASNPGVFAKYKDEWSRRMLFANAMLGTALGGVLVAAVAYTISEKSKL